MVGGKYRGRTARQEAENGHEAETDSACRTKERACLEERLEERGYTLAYQRIPWRTRRHNRVRDRLVQQLGNMRAAVDMERTAPQWTATARPVRIVSSKCAEDAGGRRHGSPPTPRDDSGGGKEGGHERSCRVEEEHSRRVSLTMRTSGRQFSLCTVLSHGFFAHFCCLLHSSDSNSMRASVCICL